MVAITLLLVSFVTNSAGNEGNKEFLTVKVIEASGASLGSFMMIVDENGKEETIDLERLSTKKTTFTNNLVTINNTLNKIGDKGYKLVAQSGGGDQYCIFTTYTFVKQ